MTRYCSHRPPYATWLANVTRLIGRPATWDRWAELHARGATPAEAAHAWSVAGRPDRFAELVGA